MVPAIVEDAFGGLDSKGMQNLPYWLQKNEYGTIFYATVFSV